MARGAALRRSQGLSNAQIGVLFSLPVLVQAALNLVGGAYTDRMGGRRIMLASCWVMVGRGPLVPGRKGILDAARRADRR